MQQLTPLHRHRQQGITLLESLIAILVSALGILGILGVQMRTLSDTQTSVRRGQAIRLIEDLGERMRVNPNALININQYLSGYTPPEKKEGEEETTVSCESSACTPAQQAQFDLQQWKAEVQQNLPAGQASIFLAPGETVDANRRQLGVMIAWRENERANTKTDAIDASKVRGSDGSFSAGTDDDNACPEGFTCHLQYLPVAARCAPYGSGGTPYCS